MKKLFGDKKFSKEKIIRFIDKKGFYVVLAACVIVVGVAAVLISRGSMDLSGRKYDDGNIIPGEMGEDFVNDTENFISGIEEEGVLQSSKDTVGGEMTDSMQASANANAGGATAQDGLQKESSMIVLDDAAEKDTLAAAEAEKKDADDGQKTVEQFIMPVFGEITFEFAMNKLVYSKTLDDWRTHSGTDIASSTGTPVKAVADGVVTQIKHDPRFGIAIILDHGGGLKTVYCNLANDSMVTPNQKVKQGDVISSIGSTALFESAEPAHLHFEVWKDESPVDPRDYLSLNR